MYILEQYVYVLNNEFLHPHVFTKTLLLKVSIAIRYNFSIVQFIRLFNNAIITTNCDVKKPQESFIISKAEQ